VIYVINETEFDEDELEEMDDDELAGIRLEADKIHADQKILLGRGKVDYANGGAGLSPQQYSRIKNIQNEAEGLMKCIDLILMERKEHD